MSTRVRVGYRAITMASCALLALTSANVRSEQIAMETAGAASVLAMIPQAMAPYWSDAGVDLQLSLGQTLTKSLLKLGRGKLDTAVVPPSAFVSMQHARPPYKNLGNVAKEAASNVRSLFGLPGSVYHAITWADDDITEWKDGVNKRIYVGPPAGIANDQIHALTSAAGLKPDQYESVRAPWGVGAQSFKDGQFDIYISVFGLGSQTLAEMSLSRNIRLLGVPGSNMIPPADLVMQPTEIPAHTYPGQVNEESVLTWQTVMMMAARKDLPDDIAYSLTKTYFENRLAVAESNASLSTVATTDYFAGVNAPLHPGAVKYYRELNISIPENLLIK
ncbi:TAXI family TRAP transporter solute-binding subunit [Marinomonas balearica]|uniref:TRAP transporter TAXI family solute receptor n=1 Tax=Marinomonas balearica TaxID=491947 RepID=A0A4R6M3G8_9GAMM|nr:TAXI family TRAP transporter solute-binding subunit [Marinomonas balearica]TDO95821.1 hypothetical protein DFP79_3179 [Marinomonas balearica]